MIKLRGFTTYLPFFAVCLLYGIQNFALPYSVVGAEVVYCSYMALTVIGCMYAIFQLFRRGHNRPHRPTDAGFWSGTVLNLALALFVTYNGYSLVGDILKHRVATHECSVTKTLDNIAGAIFLQQPTIVDDRNQSFDAMFLMRTQYLRKGGRYMLTYGEKSGFILVACPIRSRK
jgi:hypothetical protein